MGNGGPSERSLLDGAGVWFERLERWVLACLVLFLCGFALLQIVLRNFFSTGIVWGDSMLRHTVLWCSLLGAARATAEGRHIHIDLLPQILPERYTRFVRILGNAFPLAVSVALLYASLEFVVGEMLSGSIAFGPVRLWWLELAFPLSFALMAFRFGWRLFEGPDRGPGSPLP
ncbi:MAG: TRAP transporter small permease subunit [Desulfobacteraceae bacterium]|nr:TRAP transporter small permease subunit [Desulfobacteraceae bacterium]